LDLRYIHLYRDDSVSDLDADFIADKVAKIFQNYTVDIRQGFEEYWKVEHFDEQCLRARITEPKQPFERQPRSAEQGIALYDGFELQQLFRTMVSDDELNWHHAHIVVTEKLSCTFDEESWRYHARTVICGTPSIVSTSGIVEGPARPKEYYYLARSGLVDHQLLKKFEGRFIDHSDRRLSSVVLVYVVQAIFFHLTGGEPFCEDEKCLMFNAHWQDELIAILSNPAFCPKHKELLRKFNAKREV
jgi:hypothetical protein